MDNCKQTSFLPDFRSCCFNVGSFVGGVVKLVCPHCILQTLCISSSLKHYTVTYMLICLISNFTTFLEFSESVLTDLVIIVIGISPRFYRTRINFSSKSLKTFNFLLKKKTNLGSKIKIYRKLTKKVHSFLNFNNSMIKL